MLVNIELLVGFTENSIQMPDCLTPTECPVCMFPRAVALEGFPLPPLTERRASSVLEHLLVDICCTLVPSTGTRRVFIVWCVFPTILVLGQVLLRLLSQCFSFVTALEDNGAANSFGIASASPNSFQDSAQM